MNIPVLSGNLIWITGIAILIANIGWNLWRRRLEATSSNKIIDENVLLVSLFTFCFGILLSTKQLWAVVIFSILLALLFFITIFEIISRNREPQ